MTPLFEAAASDTRSSRNLYTLPVFDAPPGGPRQNFAKMFISGKTRMIGGQSMTIH